MARLTDYYDPHSLSATYYDVVARHDPTLAGDLDFYKGLIPNGSWVLELGCGTGRIALPLADDDRAVVGLDLSAELVARANAKRARMPAEVIQRTAFVQGDMTGFELNHRFDAVISPFFSVSHLPPGSQRVQMFRAAARHLVPGGPLAVHAVLPEIIEGEAPLDPSKPVIDSVVDAEGRRLRVYVLGQDYDRDTARFEQRVEYVLIGPDGAETRRSQERLTYYLSDLEAEAKAGGLTLERKISPFNQVGEMWVFRKP